MNTCFFIGHREAPQSLLPKLREAVEELKDRDFQTSWTHSGMIIEFKANDCVVNNIKIVIGVEK